MNLYEFTFPSADGTTPIHAVEWTPNGPVRGVLQISHGVAEYLLRYGPLAEFLTQQGYAVVGHDHLGHGSSVAPGGTRLYFGPPGSWNTVVDDLHTRHQLALERFPGVPHFLLGHSMGSFLLRTYLLRRPAGLTGAILMGTGQMRFARIAGAAARMECRRVGERNVSPLILALSFVPYNRHFAPNRTEVDWISRNPENVDAYCADPLCGELPTAGLFREMLGCFPRIFSVSSLRSMDPALPLLFLSGAEDPVGDFGKGVQRAVSAAEQAGVREVTCKLYPGLRHEILNERERETVFRDLLRWMDAHSTPAAQGQEAP